MGRKAVSADKRLYLGNGDYGKDANGTWWVRTPRTGMMMSLLDLAMPVTEHSDKTITVGGIITHQVNRTDKFQWKLEHGTWKEIVNGRVT